MFDRLASLPNRRWWWFLLVVFGIFLEGTALYYQYVLEALPCVICIHVRLLIAAVIVVWFVAGCLVQLGWIRIAAQFLSLLAMAALIERSWQLLATENGWVAGSCEMSLGLPPWAAVDQWMPWLFEIHEPCGYTPYMVAKISMAEVLMAMSIIMFILFSVIAFASWIRRR